MTTFIAADVIGRHSPRSTTSPLVPRAFPQVAPAICAALVLALGSAACSREPGQAPSADPTPASTDTPTAEPPRSSPILRPRLAELRVDNLTPPPLRVPGLAESLDALSADAFFKSFERAPDDDPTACRASVAIGYALIQNRQPVLSADAGEAYASFEGEVFCPDPAGSRSIEGFRFTHSADRPFGGAHAIAGPARLAEVLREVVSDGADALFGQVRMRHADDASVLDALANSDHPGLLAEACSEAGERRLEAAVDHLVRLTAHGQRRVAVRAGAALGLLKVSSAAVVRALVQLTEGPDAEKHLVAVHALADIDTAETRRYLETIALGHPTPAIRQLARERLGRRGEEPAPEPEPVP